MAILEKIIYYIPSFALFVVVTYAIVLAFALKLYLHHLIKRRERFHKAFILGLEKSTIKSLDDVINIYKSVNGFSSDEKGERYGLNKLLREFLFKLISYDFPKNYNDELIISWKDMVSDFIKKNEELCPFSDLPNIERNLLIDVTTFLDIGDKDSIKRKINKLASTIQSKYEYMDKLEKINKWSRPLAIISIALTVIFGIASLIKF